MRRVAVIPAIIEQHFGDAAFLWSQRARQIDGRLLGEAGIGRLDQRLEANLVGMAEAGAAGWDLALARLADFPEAGELFVVAWLALGSGEPAAVEAALAAAGAAGEAAQAGFSGALARLGPERLRPVVAPWLAAADPMLRWLAACALSHHRVDPGPRLGRMLDDADPRVRARALRLAGELGRVDLVARLAAATQAETEAERFDAARAACLLGAAAAAGPALDAIAETGGARAGDALELRLLAWPRAEARDWLRARFARRGVDAAAVERMGALDDPAAVPWLIRRMREPALAHAAGAAFRDIHAVDFEDTDLFVADPETLGPDFAAADAPLPVADRVSAWCDRNAAATAEPFVSMRRARLAALRAAIAAPGAKLADWRRTRRYPAWM